MKKFIFIAMLILIANNLCAQVSSAYQAGYSIGHSLKVLLPFFLVVGLTLKSHYRKGRLKTN